MSEHEGRGSVFPPRVLLAVLASSLLAGTLVGLGLAGWRYGAGILLLGTGLALFAELVRVDGWAEGGGTTYGVAVVALLVELALPFITWYDLWLTTLCGFGATLSMVTAACMPYLDRRRVPDMMEEVPSDAEVLRIEGKSLSPQSQSQLLLYSQIAMGGNFLAVWETIHRHAGG